MKTPFLICLWTVVYVQAQVQDCQPRQTGRLCDKCIDGWYGKNCTHACRQNCKSCDSLDICLHCKSGYYGNACQMSCGVGCLNGLCDKQSGACSPCMGGYRDYDCSQYCSEGCIDKLCRQDDAECTLGCKPGFFGANCCQPGMFGWSCEINCPTNCASCTYLTECQSCKEGFYGSKCNQNCPDMCKICISPSYCPACKTGYSGYSCQRRCSEKCLTCNNDGTCLTCKDGFSRPDTNCKCSGTLCTSPECTSCANSTYYAEGSTCCPCNINCKHGECTSADQCTNGCEDGLFGPKCEFPCTQIDINCSVCIGNTIKSSVCNTCSNGYYPDTKRTCVQCSKLCVEGQCNSTNGHCEKGCQDGYWDPACNQSCSEKCIVCNQNSGHCLTCSSTGVFGEKCDMSCSNACIDASCHMNGTCKRGCISDYYGPSCEQCPTNCAPRGNGTRCSRTTGLCLYGCNEGFEGDGCVETLKLDNTKDTVPAAAIGVGVAAVAVVALVMVVEVSIFVRRRNRIPVYDNVVRDTHDGRPEHAYDDIQMSLSAGTMECSTTVVTTHVDYQNTSDRLSESPEQILNEEHTYEIGL